MFNFTLCRLRFFSWFMFILPAFPNNFHAFLTGWFDCLLVEFFCIIFFLLVWSLLARKKYFRDDTNLNPCSKSRLRITKPLIWNQPQKSFIFISQIRSSDCSKQNTAFAMLKVFISYQNFSSCDHIDFTKEL
jgi:hypothetical protein